MAEVLLIHGSCHGAWCWGRVIDALAMRGVTARAIDLPRGGDTTLGHYADAINAACDGPTVLLGHSAGGFAITAAALQQPPKAMIYLCAYRPAGGVSLAQMRRAWHEQPLVPHIRLTDDRRHFSFDPAMLDDLFYHDCDDAARALARAHLAPEPVAPQNEALPAPPDQVPQHYIRCKDDRAIPPALQSIMAQGLPATRRYDLASSHSPFFSQPKALADLIAPIAAAGNPA